MRYIESYVHNSRVGVLLELHADDEAARENYEFCRLARDLALQIAAGKPKSPGELLDQPFVKGQEESVSHRIYVVSTMLNTPIRVTRFVRYDADAA
jgi:translation elongation factor EF-Ts